MASSDELRKDGWLYFKQDPQLGEIRGLDPWAVENGIHLIRTEEDGAEGIMMIRNSNRQQYGTVHGGVLVAFADSIGGHSLIAHGKICVTQGSTVNFLRPAAGEYLVCKAKPLKVGKRICVVSVEQYNDRGDLVTTALFTFAVVEEVEPLILPPACGTCKTRARSTNGKKTGAGIPLRPFGTGHLFRFGMASLSLPRSRTRPRCRPRRGRCGK